MYNLKYSNPEDINLSSSHLQYLKDFMNYQVEDNQIFGGEIIIARHGIIGFHETFGTSATVNSVNSVNENLSSQSAHFAQKSDIYLLMSLSKVFISILILRAIDEGHLSLNTKVSDFLPDFAVGNKKNVTIFHLLTHQGGTFAPLYPIPPYSAEDFGNLKKMCEMVSAQSAQFSPGERVVYNAMGGHAVLGQLLVELDKNFKNRNFAQIAQDEIFTPLEMFNTSYGNTENNPNRVIAGYTEKMSTFATKKFTDFFNNMANNGCEVPAAGAFSTASDIFRLVNTLYNDGVADNGYRLLSKALLNYAKQNHCEDMINEFWDNEAKSKGLPRVPAMFNLLGGYVRGNGHFITGGGYSASPSAYHAVGGGSTMWMIDPKYDLIVIMLSSGFIEGLAHFERISRINDLALGACL